MKKVLFRIYCLFCTLLTGLSLRAQELDDDDMGGGRRGADDFDGLEGMMDYQPLHFGMTEIMVVVLLLLACYVFGKIWKGCSYLILLIAAAFYFLLNS